MEFAPPQFVDVAGRRLAYEEVTPDDPQGTVLLLCGIGAKRQGWYKQLPVLGERLILVVTSAGGATHVSTSSEVMRAMMPGAEHVESGDGARRVCSLVSGPGFAERHPEAIEEFVQIAQHNPMHVDAYLRQLTACRAHDVADRLAEIALPTLVIHGDADPLVRIENGRHLAANIPGAELIVYDGVGHIPEVECFERFNDDLLSFLSRRSRRTTSARDPEAAPPAA
jgi:3-oxoadipate enol-lactonase